MLGCRGPEAARRRRAALPGSRLLRIPEDVLSVQVLRRSIDAGGCIWCITPWRHFATQEKQVLRRCRDRRVSRAPGGMPCRRCCSSPEVPPVVVGAGPGQRDVGRSGAPAC